MVERAAERDGQTIGIVLADDHAVVRDALRVLLESEPDMEVLAEAGDVEAGIDGAMDADPPVVAPSDDQEVGGR